jgi:hypothetical protein
MLLLVAVAGFTQAALLVMMQVTLFVLASVMLV